MSKQVERQTVRIEGFSDGVFSIAITLLVIEIKVPGHEQVNQGGLMSALMALWPSYLAFITSFTTILVIWVHHHWIFDLLKKNDHAFLYWNGLLLFCVCFLPFPTALLAEFLLHADATVAANLYTGTFLAISLAFSALWRHAFTHLIPDHVAASRNWEMALINRQYRFGPPLYFIVFMVSFYSEAWSIALCLLLAFFYAIRGWPIRNL